MARDKRSPSPLREVFGANLRAARKAKGLTIFDVSYAAQVDWSYVTQIEGGRKNLSIDVMDALAKAVGVSVIELLDNPKTPSKASSVSED